MKRSIKRSLNVAPTRIVLCAVIVCAIFVIVSLLTCITSQKNNAQEPSSSKAYAVDLQTASASYDNAVAALDQVQAEYDAVTQKANDLQSQINETTAAAFDAQKEMIKYQEALREMAAYEYRNHSTYNVVSTIVTSGSFDELLKNLDYANAVMQYQANVSGEQKKRKEDFEKIVDDLTQKSADYQSTIAEATQKHNDAQAVVNAAAANLSAAQSAELSSRAESIGGGSGGDNTGGGSGGGGGTGGGGGDTPTPSPTPTPTPTPTETWNSGLASAYGGSSDPHTPNPGTTATGAVCDDWSTGVAVPMAWPNYRSYFNHTVKIRYNGMTVLATINDCGYMGAGSRSLDLQPGVFKAFGFSTCKGWGLRQVDYIIL